MTISEIQKEISKSQKDLKGVELQKCICEIVAKDHGKKKNIAMCRPELVPVYEGWEDVL